MGSQRLGGPGTSRVRSGTRLYCAGFAPYGTGGAAHTSLAATNTASLTGCITRDERGFQPAPGSRARWSSRLSFLHRRARLLAVADAPLSAKGWRVLRPRKPRTPDGTS